jgi:hypothetical protein
MSPGKLQRERGELRGISMKIEKTEHPRPKLSILQRLPSQPVVRLPRQQAEDAASPLLLP